MLKKIVYLLVLFTSFAHAQTVSVNDSSHSPTDLANLLLNGSCIDPTNISSSSSESVAYFNNNGGAFPLNEGIILRSGIASHTAGMYTGNNLTSAINTVNDPDLNAIADAVSGQDADITDTAFLQFDFVPISSDFTFNFIFTSNEYGQWQCGFSDVFAFLLTDLGSGTTTNLAIIPGTTTPIAVTTVRDNTYNGSCTSENPGLFDTYNVDNPAASTINMRGYTTPLSASSVLTPGNSYRIRLVIGDFNTNEFDSAVFIDAGSFNTEIDLGEDTTICEGDQFTLTTGLSQAEYNHSWTQDGNPIGSNSNSLTVTEAGVYQVIASQIGTSCQIPGEITITDLSYAAANDLTQCDTGATTYSYNLTLNNENTLGINDDDYNLFYFENTTDIPNNPILAANLTNYQSAGNQTIYIKIFNPSTGRYCDAEIAFDLTLSASPTANQPADIEFCSGDQTIVDLTPKDSEVLDTQPASDYTVSYHTSQNDAENGENSLGGSFDTSSSSSPITIWVRIESNSNTDCYNITSFQIIIHPLPNVPTLDSVLDCDSYVLPDLSEGTYYDQSGGPAGGGNQYNPGDSLEEGGVYYVFVGPDENGCTNESSFTVTFIDEYTIDVNYCESMIIPSPIEGIDSNFYTEPGGPSGTGTLIPAGTLLFLNSDGDLEYQGLSITIPGNTDTIYFYAEINGTFCHERDFPISLYQDPEVDQPDDVVTCLNYTLPALTNGNYEGYNPGDVISSTEEITISNAIDYNATDLYGDPTIHTCTASSTFTVTIISEPTTQVHCGSYTLPDLEVGEYYFEANGQGNIIPQGTTIIINEDGDLEYQGIGITISGNTDDIYIYSPDTENATNCSSNMFFTLTINPIPTVDLLENGIYCISTPYELPTLTNGNYFTEPGGMGTALNPGDIITSSQTIYIYNFSNGCPNESSFSIEIRELPPVDSYADVYQCESYTLLPLTNGNYYNENGDQLSAGTEITETTTLTIYNEWNDLEGCSNQTTFTLNILGVNVGTFGDINTCDSYELPPLEMDGNYYSAEQNGEPDNSQLIPVGTVYTSTPSDPIYVYAYNQERIVCTDQTSFTITISNTPVLPNFNNVEVCEGYTLPVLDNSSYNVNYYWEPGGINPLTATEHTLTEGEHTVYVYATAANNTECYDEESFTVTVFPLRDLEIEGGIICIDPITNESLSTVVLDSGLSPAQYTVEWYLNNNLMHTGPSYIADTAGTYTVEFTKLTPDNPPFCNYNSTTVTVEQSSVAVLTEDNVIVSEYFTDENTITVNITGGYGQYVYQLDGGVPQESNVFSGIPSGEHTITVTDIYGNCGSISVTVYVVNYPKFFSPNGDGYNETWNIVDLAHQPETEIIIFNRFGKFITNFSPASNGWDGTYNGRPAFSDDYWFVIKYKNRAGEDKEFRAHFSLKR